MARGASLDDARFAVEASGGTSLEAAMRMLRSPTTAAPAGVDRDVLEAMAAIDAMEERDRAQEEPQDTRGGLMGAEAPPQGRGEDTVNDLVGMGFQREEAVFAVEATG